MNRYSGLSNQTYLKYYSSLATPNKFNDKATLNCASTYMTLSTLVADLLKGFVYGCFGKFCPSQICVSLNVASHKVLL